MKVSVIPKRPFERSISRDAQSYAEAESLLAARLSGGGGASACLILDQGLVEEPCRDMCFCEQSGWAGAAASHAYS